MPTDGNYDNWDWEDQSQPNWKRKKGSNWEDIVPPFAAETKRVGTIVNIRESRDYTKEKGWQLVAAQFNSVNPFFILYNPHKAIVRAFFYLEEYDAYSDALATLYFDDVNNPGTLSFGKEYQSSTEAYYNNTATGNDDMIAVVIREIIGPETWCAADFPILFDNNIKASKFNSKKWVFRFYGCDNYNLTLDGGVASDLSYLQNQFTMTTAKSTISENNDFNAQYAKVHKQIQSIDKFLQEMQTSTKNINDSSANFLKTYKNVVKDIKGLASIVSAISGVSSGFSAIIGFFNLITGTFDESSTKPAATLQYIKLTGTMTVKKSLSGNTFSIPGVNGTYVPTGLNWQPFNCPMGIVNLQKTPTIKRTSAYNKYGFYDTRVSYGWQGDALRYIYPPGFPQLLAGGSHPLKTSYAVKYPGKFRKYKFDDDITLTIQQLNGLELTDVKFAIVCKANGTGDRKYKVGDKYIAYHGFYGLTGQEHAVPLDNPVYKALMEGKLIIHKIELENEQNEQIYFGTPFMDKNKLKGVVLELPEDTDVKLAVFAKFQSDKYTEPVLFKAMYNLTYAEEASTWAQTFFTYEQPNFPFSDFYNTYSTLTLNSSNNTQNTASVITMVPGFVGTSGFVAKSLPITKDLENGNTIVNVINFNCSSMPAGAPAPHNMENALSNNEIESDETQNPALFPNPTRGILRIESKSENPLQTISVYSSIGQKMLLYDNLNVSNMEIDLSALPSGMYIVTLNIGNRIYSDKIILQK